MKKIIVYDFDKTLTRNDTLFGFFIFNEKRNLKFFIKSFNYILLMVLAKIKFISNFKLKDLGVKLFLKNLSKDDLNYKFLNYKNSISYNFLFEKANFKDENIFIISASFEEYLKGIFPSNVHIIASKLKYNLSTAEGLDFNCYGKEKVEILKKIGIEKIDIFYTDSMSDLPLVEISNKTILIKNNSEIICNNTQEFIEEIKK